MRHRDLWAGEAARRGIACVGIAARRHRMGGGCSGRAMHLITAAAHAGSGDSVRSPLASDGHAVDSGHDGSMGEIGRRGAMRHRAGNGPCAVDESVCRDVCRTQWMGLADGSYGKMRARDGHGSTRDVSGRMRRAPVACRMSGETRAGMETVAWAVPVPRAGVPPPALPADVAPVAVVERRPTPRVPGDKGPTPSGIVAPGTIIVRVPVGTDVVGLPDLAIAGLIGIRAISAEIGDSGSVGIVTAGILRPGGSVLIVVAIALLIPGIFRLLGNAT